MAFGLFITNHKSGVRTANTMFMALLVLCLNACIANAPEPVTNKNSQASENEKWPVYYVPMQEDHKTVYGGVFYHGNDDNRKAESPFAPWNITATEICFASGSGDKEKQEVCQRLERYAREGKSPVLSIKEEGDRLRKESFFSILLPRARYLHMKSVTLHGKEYSYVITFTSNPTVEMPDSDFVNFGFLGLSAQEVAGKTEPEISFVGTIALPFKPALKVTGATCAAVSYDIPHVVKHVPLQKPNEKTFP